MKYLRFFRTLPTSETPVWLIFKCLLTLLILYFGFAVAKPEFAQGGGTALSGLVLTLVLGLGLNILWRDAIIDFITSPLTNLFTGGNEAPNGRPFYFIATAKRKRGQYAEAMADVRKQLEIFPDDFEGVLLLASIQAENLNDLSAAENTLSRFCDRPAAPLKLAAAAFTQLADWHIKAADTDSARAVFQKIVERFPDTELALQAEQRMAHLGQTRKIMLDQHERKNLVVPPGVPNIGLLNSTEFLQPRESDPVRLAAAHVKRLEAHPHDTEAREKLAMIYTKDFKRLDLAVLELEHLINEPNHKPRQVAHWLNLLANFQIELGADVATVQATLNNIVERFPDLPVAETAQRRLALLNNEFRGRQETTVVKLGVYEKNIGLTYGLPRRQ
jgi:tetratricopeptide (TPR) repeat protein